MPVSIPDSPYAAYNEGIRAYGEKRFEAAERLFAAAAEGSEEEALSAQARYNLGTTLFRRAEGEKEAKGQLEQLGRAEEAFRRALAHRSTYTEAAQNLELTRRRIHALRKAERRRQEAQ
ncbi:MAG: hypothetical protein ACYTGH_20935, partial [Planctomycetota bacterium]